jgi:exodeoxyribonuclease VII small subunit
MDEKPVRFEDALNELEQIIAELEGGELTLDESLERYERGIKALNACRKVLSQAEKKIQLLLRTSEGELTTRPFEADKVVGPEPRREEQGGEETPF